MNPFPIVHRELLVLSRRRWFYWLRTGVGLAMVFVGVLVFTVTWNVAPNRNLGTPLFYTVISMSYFICALIGPVLLADSVAEEKSAGTLGLLFLTNTRSHDIIAGKFAAFALPALHCLLAAVPIMATAFFLGGVTGGEFLRATAALLNLMFFSLAATMLCSVIAPTGRTAFGLALVLVLFCCGGLPSLMLAWPNSTLSQLWIAKMLAGPALAFCHSPDAMLAAIPSTFRFALGTSHALAWMFLAAAACALPFHWRDRANENRGLVSRVKETVAKFRRRPDPRSSQIIGSKEQASSPPRNCSVPFPYKSKFKGIRHSLPDEAIAWLTHRRLGGTSAAWWLTMTTAIMISISTFAIWGGGLAGLAAVCVAYAMHGVFKIWVGWVSSRAFAAERDSGALELLLITPLGDNFIWRAWLKGLRRRFLFPALTLVAFDLMIAWHLAVHVTPGDTHLEIFFLTLLAVPVFLLDCYTLIWTGLWSGLSARNSTRACIRTMLWVLIVPGAIFFNILAAAALSGGMNDDLFILFVCVWAGVSFLVDLVFGTLAMIRLSHDCRKAAVSG